MPAGGARPPGLPAMFAAWADPVAADSVLRSALGDAVAELEQHAAPLATLREEALRTALFESLARRLPGHVRTERHLKVPACRGCREFRRARGPRSRTARRGSLRRSGPTPTRPRY